MNDATLSQSNHDDDADSVFGVAERTERYARHRSIRSERAGRMGLRVGLIVVIAWIGAMKFTSYEAEGISIFVNHSPLMAWMYDLLTPGQFSVLLGLVELTIAALIAIGLYRPRCGVAGAAAATGMFLTTLSFMVTTPGVFEPAAGGFPALSVIPGQFLVKDAALLAISFWLLIDGLHAVSVCGRQSCRRTPGAREQFPVFESK